MYAFSVSAAPLDPPSLSKTLLDHACGAFVSFEGWVRNHNEQQVVLQLEYEAFEALAVKEGERILATAGERFAIEHISCVHRIGLLQLGELAVWVGVSAAHRDAAFAACRYVIDEVKLRVPIWKKEHYQSGQSGWINCADSSTQPART